MGILVYISFVAQTFPETVTKNLPDELNSFLLNQIRLNKKQLAGIQSGQTIVKALPTEKREEIAIFGIVHMDVSPEHFLNRFREIIEFESGNGILQNGVFSTPPQLSDVSNLTWENDDLEKIRECKPSNCTARLPGGSVSQFHTEVDWSSDKAIQQANDLMRRLIVEYITKYQNVGDNALTEYYKDGSILSVKTGSQQLLMNSPYLHHYVPELASYLRNYPNEKNPNAEDIFYWQKAEFGLQPVIRLNHVVILELKNSSHTNYVIASKMLFANHYFRDGLEIRSLIPDLENHMSKSFYFLILNRSHVDGMTGFKGRLIRGTVVDKSAEKLKAWLMKAKVRMESDYQKSKGFR
ncbi:MAG TPA: hypothetical protein VLH08_00655 [Acidobacteriota bacterium]|nr:hypothetical protein [Acidobacteriota bacterium]